MKDKLSIGQMSKLHSIPIKTLRYYDEIDLFKPIEVNQESGYRYYSTEQFKQLDIINYLKTLGVPLKEIKRQLHSRDINEFLQALKKHHSTIEEKIKEFENIKKRLEIRMNEIDGSQKIERIGVPILKNIPSRKVVRLQEKIQTVHELEISLRKLKNEFKNIAPIFLGKVGLTHTLVQVKNNNFAEYNSIFLVLEESGEQELFHDMMTIFPEGTYCSIFYRGVRSDSPNFYRILLEFIHEKNYEILGDFIERAIVDQFISNDKTAFLTEIQVRVKEKDN